MRSFMKITKLEAKNYKSFNHLETDFNDFTLIVGANASGKSNLMSLFKFIKDIMLEGLENAIAMQGGIEYLANANSDKGTPISISFNLELDKEQWYMRKTADTAFSPRSFSYKFEITPHLRGKNYNISYDELIINFEIVKREKIEGSRKFVTKNLKEYQTCTIIKKNTHAKYEMSGDEFRDINFLLDELSRAKNEILLYRLSYFLPPLFAEENLIKVYDFDPQKLKRPCVISARKTLETDGANLAFVLQNVLKTKSEYQKFIRLLSNSLPFVTKLSVEQNYDQSYAYKLGEKYSNKSFYAQFLSDGTVSIIAIIIALYFQDKSEIVIIEEPERNIHPKLLGMVVQMAKDVAMQKQVIFTTHNPEILNNSTLESIRFIQRNKNGFSVVSTPANNERVKTFINNELGLSELFLLNLLGE